MAGESDQTLLREIVTEASVSVAWEDVKAEWFWSRMWHDQPSRCICKHPIFWKCEIENSLNGNRLIVGNCCIKQFDCEGAAAAVSATSGLKGILEDANKHPGTALTEYARETGIISWREQEFLLDTLRKRTLSEKQLAWRVAINRRIAAKLAPKRLAELDARAEEARQKARQKAQTEVAAARAKYSHPSTAIAQLKLNLAKVRAAYLP